ncbi:MAG: plastocyanin/azurin family copper-binding protein [Halobacterium sp.]
MNSDADERVSRRSFLRSGATAAAAGAAVTGTAAAQEGKGGSSGPKIVEVGPGGRTVFAPETVYVTPGTTVKWEWKSPGHNVHTTSTPEGADWSANTKITGPPFTYSYTFDGPTGEYKYQCDPHAALGMKGTVVVTNNPPKQEGFQSLLGKDAKTAAIAAVGSMTSVLGLTYFFMRYGGDYGEGDAE